MISIESFIGTFLFVSFYLGAFAVAVWLVYSHIADSVTFDAESKTKGGTGIHARSITSIGLRKLHGAGSSVTGIAERARSALREVDRE
jgi:hypothetical protein